MLTYKPYKHTIVNEEVLKLLETMLKSDMKSDGDYTFTVKVVTSDCYYETIIDITDIKESIVKSYIVVTGTYFRTIMAKNAITFQNEVITEIKKAKENMQLDLIFEDEPQY